MAKNWCTKAQINVSIRLTDFKPLFIDTKEKGEKEMNAGEKSKEEFLKYFLTEHIEGDQKKSNYRKYNAELGDFKYTIGVPHDVMRQIVSTCNKIICEMKSVYDSGFGYDDLLQYLDANRVDIAAINDYDNIEMLWQQKLGTDKMRGLVADLYRICTLSEPQIKTMDLCLMMILVNCYIAIASDFAKDDQFDVIDYLNLLVVTVTEIWALSTQEES